MKRYFNALRFLTACLLVSGCSSPSGPIRLDSSTQNFVAPSNFVDLRPERSKRTVADGNKTYYGDDTLIPDIATQLWSKLDRALSKGALHKSPRIVLEEAEVVVALPRSEDVAMGGPLVWIADRKYLRVDITGKVESRAFTSGVYKKQFSYPDEKDIAAAVDEAVDSAVLAIISELKRSSDSAAK